MQRGLVSEFQLTLSTLVTRRNQADMVVSTPLGELDSFVNQSITLAKKATPEAAESVLDIGAVQRFLYLHTTGPVVLQLTATTGGVTRTSHVVVDRFYIATIALDSVIIKNQGNAAVEIKTIHS